MLNEEAIQEEDEEEEEEEEVEGERKVKGKEDDERERERERGKKRNERKGNKRGSRRLPYFEHGIASAASIGVMIRGGTFAFLIGINRAGGSPYTSRALLRYRRYVPCRNDPTRAICINADAHLFRPCPRLGFFHRDEISVATPPAPR